MREQRGMEIRMGLNENNKMLKTSCHASIA